ncbi:MAG: RIP metalloprotease RseP [Owenweeksia sp.]|nr:RIP metalloprotease RseP [Owenweeksia sp.]
MDILIQATQFILSLSLLIILHEAGHFIPAKLFKTKVEKFYLFFDPWFSLFKKKVGDTEYGIGWLPLGGYVKIAGMIDESMDKDQMKKPPEPWEFRSKPAWQRLIIMIGGVTVNVLLAILIYAGMMMHYGEQYLPVENAKYGVVADTAAQAIGLRNGDKIIAVDGKTMQRFSDIPKEILLGDQGKITIERGGEIQEITISETDKRDLIKARSTLVEPLIPFVVDSVTAEAVAQDAGIKKGDKLVSLNGREINSFNEFRREVPKHKNEEVQVGFMRDGQLLEAHMTIPESGLMGVSAKSDFLQPASHKYGFFEAFPAGVRKSFNVLGDYIRQFKLILNPDTEAYKEVGGFLMIAQQYGTDWDWQRFWGFTAFLSIMLAFLNILPIPALDGGHVVFVLWEMISGRKPSEKVLEYAQIVGFVILMGLILLANGNDILRLFQ